MRRKKARLCKELSLLVLALGTALLRSHSVYAVNALVKARTIGELIITILAGSGTAVTNPIVIPQVYSAYDANVYSFESLIENGILTIPGMTTEEAIAELGNHTPYDLDTTEFRNLLDDNWQTMVNNGLDTVMRINDMANTDSQYGAIDNLGQIVKNVAENGYLSLENTVAIVTNPGVSVVVGLENFANAMKQVYGQNIKIGQDISTLAPQLGYCAWYKAVHPTTGSVAYTYLYSRYNHPSQWAAYGKLGYQIQDLQLGLIGWSDNQDQILVWTYIDGVLKYTSAAGTSGQPVSFNGLRGDANTYVVVDCIKPLLPNKTDALQNLQEQRDGTYTPDIVSPDIINQNYGNIAYDDDIEPSIEQGEGLQIIPSDDYNDFMDDINNTQNPEYNGDTMDELIDRYRQQEPIPTPSIVPPQPSITPKPPITDEEQNTSLGGTTKGLENIFPFCIPFDIKNIFTKLETTRQAPHITYTMEYHGKELGTIDVDLSAYDSVATILRTLEAILYIFGLAMATRQLIGA